RRRACPSPRASAPRAATGRPRAAAGRPSRPRPPRARARPCAARARPARRRRAGRRSACGRPGSAWPGMVPRERVGRPDRRTGPLSWRGMERRSLGLKTAGFRCYLGAQFLGAFNDNAYKYLLLGLITGWAAGDAARENRLTYVALGLFALPFVLLAG